jgi:alpha-L-rhamnosidase
MKDDNSIFRGARWLGDGIDGVDTPTPAPYFRRVFDYDGDEARALLLRISGLGYYELYLNGERVGDRVLDPPPEIYDKHFPYTEYTITLKRGKNTFLVLLGDGLYNCSTVFQRQQYSTWRARAKFILELLDGAKQLLVSDESWQCGASSIIFNAYRNGEFIDGRLMTPDFYLNGRPESEKRAPIVTPPGGEPRCNNDTPCHILKTLSAHQLNDTVYALDENIAGRIALTLRGKRDTAVTIRYCDQLTEDGQLYWDKYKLATQSGEFQTDKYYCSGEGIEHFEPHFVFHGFQYIEITADEPIEILEVSARVIGTAFASIGTLATDNNDINRLHACTRASYQANFVNMPMDCPHREKDGWTADAHLACDTGLWNFDAAPALCRWLDVLCDCQRPSGQIPSIVPYSGFGFYNEWTGVTWDAALIIIPYTIYMHTGDRAVIAHFAEPMMRLLRFMAQMRHSNGLPSYSLLGEWCAATDVPVPSLEYCSGAMYCRIADMLAFMLGQINSPETAEYQQLANEARAAFQRAFIRADGSVGDDTLTALALALEFGLMPDETSAQCAATKLAELSKQYDCKARFGILGAKYVPRALARYGYTELALRYFTQPEYPGWTNWLRHGAVTLWESWECNNSHNHIMFGDCDAWLYEYAAGFQFHRESPGELTIAPTPLAELGSLAGDYRGVHSEWHIDGDNASGCIVIPAGQHATLHLPGQEAKRVGADTYCWEELVFERTGAKPPHPFFEGNTIFRK